MRNRGLLLVISGPAGSGKSSLTEAVLAAEPDVGRSISATTRSPRPGEVDGEDYYFLSREAFANGIERGDFVEYAEFNGNYYGTPREALNQRLANGQVVVLVIEVKGSAQIRRAYPFAVHIFVLPPSPAVLRERLCGRGTECPAEIERRLAIATGEIECLEAYDYILINDDFKAATADLRAMIRMIRLHHVRGGEREAWLKGGYERWHEQRQNG